MRILFLNTGAELGGAERSLLDLIASLRAADATLSIELATTATGPLLDRCAEFGVRTHVLPMPRSLEAFGDSGSGRIARLIGMGPAAWGAWRYAGKLARLIDEIQPDVVHSNSIKFHLLTSLLPGRNSWSKLPACSSQQEQAGSLLHGRLLVWHVRDFVGARPIVAKALKFGAPPDGVIAISRAVADDVAVSIPNVPTRVVYNAIDVDHFSPGPGDSAWLDELAGLPAAPPRTIRVGLVATYAKWKGQDVFIDAAARLVGKAPVRFYLIGGPIYQTRGSQWTRAELEQRAASLVNAGAFGFIDFQSDPRDIYRSLDIVVHASVKPEPFGRTIVEAMACGRAVVVAKAGGAVELFDDGVDALGVTPSSAEALATALMPLIVSPERREALARNARASAVERFSRSRLGPQVLKADRQFLRPAT
jgi:glycosyltransferase involved in cell wall biosynthesis